MTKSSFTTISTYTLRRILAEARRDLDTVVVRLVQDELHARQPIKVECDYEWTATRGDYDLDDLVGRGRTEREAVDHLIEQEEDARDEAALRAGIVARAEAELDRKANAFAAVAQMEDDFYGMHEERARHP